MPTDEEKEQLAAAENEGMQSALGTNHVHPREDVDSAVPPRSGVGTSAAGVETTQPPVVEEEGEDALANPERDDQNAAIANKPNAGEPRTRPTTSGEAYVKYVGHGGTYNDSKSGIVFTKGKRTTVSKDDAVRLTARRDFVSAD